MSEDKQLPSTYRTNLVEFSNGRNWKLVNYFAISGKLAYVNGQLCQVVGDNFIPLNINSRPICSCGCCGFSPLVYHYTLKDLNSGELINVGIECFTKIMNTPKSIRIKEGIESLRRKISVDFRRPIKQKQLGEYLTRIYNDGATKKRNLRVDQHLKEDPNFYTSWSLKCVEESQKIHAEDIKRHEKDSRIPIRPEFNTSEELRNHYVNACKENYYNNRTIENFEVDAKNFEHRDRNYWEYNIKAFFNKDWSPETMKKVYKLEAERDNIMIPEKWNKLTPEQQLEEDRLITEGLNLFIRSLK